MQRWIDFKGGRLSWSKDGLPAFRNHCHRSPETNGLRPGQVVMKTLVRAEAAGIEGVRAETSVCLVDLLRRSVGRHGLLPVDGLTVLLLHAFVYPS